MACSEFDNENVVVTLTARTLNPRLRIVSRLNDVQQEVKIRKVGASAVVSPHHIGGLRLASELIRPTVVSFLDTMLRDADSSLRMDEIPVPEGGPWTYNPPRSSVIAAGSSLVILGSSDDSKELRERVGGNVVAGPGSGT